VARGVDGLAGKEIPFAFNPVAAGTVTVAGPMFNRADCPGCVRCSGGR